MTWLSFLARNSSPPSIQIPDPLSTSPHIQALFQASFYPTRLLSHFHVTVAPGHHITHCKVRRVEAKVRSLVHSTSDRVNHDRSTVMRSELYMSNMSNIECQARGGAVRPTVPSLLSF